ncbi:MAG: hypothetical protein WBS19_16170 [Candidatus Korobacteraceae bacterium]
MFKLFTIAVILSLSGAAVAQMPVAELPRVYIASTWNLPSGGTTWAAHTSAQLSSAIKTSMPGDVIVLDAGVTYSGYFQLPAKANSNNKWIYIVSSAIAKLPVGKRVSPADAGNMPKIVTPNVAADFQINGGANHWRLAGLELTSASTYCQTGRNCMSYFLVGSQSAPTPLPDSFVIDRCYIHGAPNVDLQSGVMMNASNYAVVDSYIGEVHMQGADSVALGAYWSPGPFKVVNNYLSSSTEDLMFGGSGGSANPYVPSDIEIRNNYLYKPLSWVPLSIAGKMAVKNGLELKSAQRVLFDSNTIENVWYNAQMGYAIVLTVRSSQSGDRAVVNDITITNNVLKNVVSGFNTLAKDDQCGIAPYASCKNAGSQDRWYIANNLIQHYDPTLPGGARNVAIAFQPGLDRINGGQGVMRDVVFKNNTSVAAASAPCWASVYFGTGTMKLPLVNLTQNIWVLNNALCRQPTGDWGLQGTSGLTQYMGALGNRFVGNVMYVPTGDRVQQFPTHNYASTIPFTYASVPSFDYQLVTPYWTDTSDGQLSGINFSKLSTAVASGR